MNKVIQRLLIFFIGVPLVISLVKLDTLNHIILHLVIVAITPIATLEMYKMFSKQAKLVNKALLTFLCVLLPINAYAIIHFNLPLEIITYVFIFDFLVLLTSEICSAKTFEDSNKRLTFSTFILVYSGYLITFVSRMTSFEHSSNFIATFLLMVFMNDSLAWLFGNLFGKNNRGIVKASPNKSIAGFIGGIIGSILSGILSKLYRPEVFYGGMPKIILMSIIIAISGIIGDLAESVFKRSSEIKDSGTIIPGRGGILDSIDSVLMSAPVYYLLISLLYKN